MATLPFREKTAATGANDVNVEGLAYRRMLPAWELVRALMGGTAAMREAGKKYLPQEPKESAEAYQNRLGRSVLFNGFKRTVKTLVGKPFAKAPTLADGVHSQIQEWLEDVDRNGTHWTIYARSWLEDAMQTGISHTLVDFPPARVDDQGNVIPRTLADERAEGIRPYFVHVPAEALIGWRSAKINGKETLTQIRIREPFIEDEGPFGERERMQVRVIYPDRWEIWRSEDEKNWTIFQQGPNTLGEIPLVTLYTARKDFMVGEPPLMDLAELNAQHWRSSSDQEHILHVVRVPILFAKNLASSLAPDGQPQGEPTFEIGPNRMIVGPENSDMKYVEHSGQAIGAGRQALIDLEDRMVVMGLELQVRRPGIQTATQKIIDTEESNSELHAMVANLKDATEQALGFMAKWARLSTDGDGGSVTYNTDFGISMRNAQEIDLLLRARQAGEISRETFLRELLRRGFLDESVKVDEEIERVEEEKPDLEGQPLPLPRPDQRPALPPRA